MARYACTLDEVVEKAVQSYAANDPANSRSKTTYALARREGRRDEVVRTLALVLGLSVYQVRDALKGGDL